MNIVEKDLLEPLLNSEAECVILQHEENIKFYDNLSVLIEGKKVTSDDIFHIMLEIISSQQQRDLLEHGIIIMHYRFMGEMFTFHLSSINGDCQMIIKKGKFDIGSDSSVLIPQVQLGDVYERKRENLSDSHIKMTVDGTENDFGIRFLCERDGWHRFEVLKLEEFLTLLSEGKMYKIR